MQGYVKLLWLVRKQIFKLLLYGLGQRLAGGLLVIEYRYAILDRFLV